jgi:hypothetical protein
MLFTFRRDIHSEIRAKQQSIAFHKLSEVNDLMPFTTCLYVEEEKEPVEEKPEAVPIIPPVVI